MKSAPVITLSDSERKILETWSRGRSTQARRVLRAKIVLMRLKVRPTETNCRRVEYLEADRRTLASALRGVARGGDRKGCSSSWSHTGRVCGDRDLIVRKTTQEKPEAATHWNTRTMAQAVGVSKDTVQSLGGTRSESRTW